MPRAVIVSFNNRSGNVEVLTTGHHNTEFAPTPEGMMAFARWLQRISTTLPPEPISPPKELALDPELTEAEIKAHPNYQKFLFPATPQGIRKDKSTANMETLVRLADTLDMDSELDKL